MASILDKLTKIYGWKLSLALTAKGHEISDRVYESFSELWDYVYTNRATSSATAGNILIALADGQYMSADGEAQTGTAGVYLVKSVAGYNAKGEADASVASTVLVKLGDASDISALQKALNEYKTEVDNTYVKKTTTIAGIDLQDNITSDELLTKLGINNVLHFKGIYSTLPEPATAYANGDVILVGTKEYVYAGQDAENEALGSWHELGDETLHVLNTRKVETDEVTLTGGGDLTADRKLSMKKISVEEKNAGKTVINASAGTDIVKSITVDQYGRVTGYSTGSAYTPDVTVTSNNKDYVTVDKSVNAETKDIDYAITAQVGDLNADVPTGFAGAANAKEYIDSKVEGVKSQVATTSVSTADENLLSVTPTISGINTDYELEVKTAKVSTATTDTKGVAEAKDVKDYVDGLITDVNTAISKLTHTTVSVNTEGTVTQSDYIQITPDSNSATATDYAVKLNVTKIADDAAGLADTQDVKDYVDALVGAVTHTTVASGNGYVIVDPDNQNASAARNYEVSVQVSTDIAAATSAESKVADAYAVKTFVEDQLVSIDDNDKVLTYDETNKVIKTTMSAKLTSGKLYLYGKDETATNTIAEVDLSLKWQSF